ncbi:MAG TPA: ROK family protein [Niabella sp.]|jgi:glucokinase|nr:ROK family protein [Niabella sp.]HQX73742.1 ROK family protein [Chitinophagaceae bacterium]HQX21522.1 ROK family protein [Niabella sp.]HRB37148.1 ROK family protein [Niabella sp.]HRB60642.1 ROK family protein [Niabella sp.]
MYSNDDRIILTLDAGGTNFVFKAIQACKQIGTQVILPSHSSDLKQCIGSIMNGFRSLIGGLPQKAVAISFAFPGPADYTNGVIGDLPNFSAFRGGVALKAILEYEFQLPVFINNDGNLFAYGEAVSGALQEINRALLTVGSKRQYRNLLGLTLGTGLGSGVVVSGHLLTGDNGCGGDLWCSAHHQQPDLIVEEAISARAVCRRYSELSGITDLNLQPHDIYGIAEAIVPGDRQAAIDSFSALGTALGFTIAETLNIIDGIVVIGGGLSGAHKYLMPALMAAIRRPRYTEDGREFPRTQTQVYNLMDEREQHVFLNDESVIITQKKTFKTVSYDAVKKTGVIITSRDTSHSVAIGAYNLALTELDIKKPY